MINRRHGGNITGKGIIDFSVNINPLGMPLALKEAVSKSLDKLSCYPEPESLSLKKALASIHNINEANLLIGNGSIEIIHLLPRALKIKKALIITPTFSEYEFAVRLSNAKPVFVKASEGNGFRIDTKLIRGLIPQANLVILCNPNNPTGVLAARETLMEILAPCIKYGKILLIDEVFLDFVDNAKEFSLLDQAVRSRHLLVLKSLTKFFAVPGLRIGYLIGHRSLILKLSKFQYPWNVNSLAQGIAKEIINCNGYRQKTKALILRERNFLSANLKKFKDQFSR